MRTKNLFFILGICVVLAYAGVAQAAWTVDSGDPALSTCINVPTGDPPVSRSYDIDAAKVETWPCTPNKIDVENEICDVYPYVGKACVKMAAGSILPGIMLIELDVDNDLNTGGGAGMTNIFGSCFNFPNKIKVSKGMDIAIVVAVDAQAKTGSTAVSAPTYTCAEKGAPCGGGGDCFSAGTGCTGTTLTMGLCYETTNNNFCGTGNAACYTMNDNTKCDANMFEPLRSGEWFAAKQSGGAEGPVGPFLRGNIEQGYVQTDTKMSIPLPLSKIIAYALSAGANFNETASKNPANWRWVISGWNNTQNNQDDFIIFAEAPITNFCTAVCDAIPSGANERQPVTVLTDAYCVTDSNNDGKINSSDLGSIKKDFLNQNCPCQKLIE